MTKNEAKELQKPKCIYCNNQHKNDIIANNNDNESNIYICEQVTVNYDRYNYAMNIDRKNNYYSKNCQQCTNHQLQMKKDLIDKIGKILHDIDKDFPSFYVESIDAINEVISEQINFLIEILLPKVDNVEYLFDINGDATTCIKNNLKKIIKYIDILKTGVIVDIMESIEKIKQLPHNEHNLEYIETIKSNFDSFVTKLNSYQQISSDGYKKLYDLIDTIILDYEINKVTKTDVKIQLNSIVSELQTHNLKLLK